MQKLFRFMVVIAVITVIWGCGKQGEKVVATVNGQKITSTELEFYLRELARTGRPVDETSKKTVFEQLVIKTLLMEEAEKRGLTKDKTLLQRIEREKERILMDEMVRREINMFASVTDEDIKQSYDKVYSSQKGKVPPLTEVKDQIRQQLMTQKRREAFDKITTDLRSKAKISLDEKALSAIMVPSPMPRSVPR